MYLHICVNKKMWMLTQSWVEGLHCIFNFGQIKACRFHHIRSCWKIGHLVKYHFGHFHSVMLNSPSSTVLFTPIVWIFMILFFQLEPYMTEKFLLNGLSLMGEDDVIGIKVCVVQNNASHKNNKWGYIHNWRQARKGYWILWQQRTYKGWLPCIFQLWFVCFV